MPWRAGRTSRYFPLWGTSLVLGCLLLAGCQPGETAGRAGSPILGTPIPSIQPPAASPTPVRCASHPAGLSVQAVLGSKLNTFQTVQVEGQGFVAGEVISIRLETLGARRPQRLEASGIAVQADGSFRDSESLQLDEPRQAWQVFVIHQRGVACAQFTTP